MKTPQEIVDKFYADACHAEDCEFDRVMLEADFKAAIAAALEAAAQLVERSASGSDDENVVEMGPAWARRIRELANGGEG